MKSISVFILSGLLISLLITMMFTGITGCQSDRETTDPEYIKEVLEWHAHRISALTRADGWLSLTGLHWLDEGKNSFGGSPENDIRFAGKNLPDHMGTFTLQDSLINMKVASGVTITHDGKPVRDIQLFHDGTGDPTTLRYQSLLWYVIKRGDRFAVRLKDTLSDRRQNFSGIERYPILSKWRVTASFTPYDPPRTMEVPTELGTVVEDPTPGKLNFRMDGQRYSLDPIADPQDKRWFIIFADETNGEETYGAGRYVYIDAPDSNGTAVIDFNKAYNPPCAFSPYATCPLPPEQNFLELRITAGEKTYVPDYGK